MGYHTWFYKEVPCDLTQGQAKDRCINYLRSWIRCYEKMLNTASNRDRVRASQRISVFQRQLRMVKKNLCKCAVWGSAHDGVNLDEKYHRGKKYTKSDLHDVFRLNKRIPNGIVFTTFESLQVILDRQGIVLTKQQHAIVAKFFKDGGMIDFG